MIYYEDNEIKIRDLEPEDAPVITAEEIAQGWDASVEKYEKRLRHRTEMNATALVAEYRGQVAGYINVYPDSPWGAFADMGYPEIVDFGVLEKFRRHGIGSKLMDVAEEIASKYSDTVYLGVGLHSGYGSAQRMYAIRGYVPDCSGAWYNGRALEPGAACQNDDELVLYMSKTLLK